MITPEQARDALHAIEAVERKHASPLQKEKGRSGVVWRRIIMGDIIQLFFYQKDTIRSALSHFASQPAQQAVIHQPEERN